MHYDLFTLNNFILINYYLGHLYCWPCPQVLPSLNCNVHTVEKLGGALGQLAMCVCIILACVVLSQCLYMSPGHGPLSAFL